jgi:hypothetical protein
MYLYMPSFRKNIDTLSNVTSISQGRIMRKFTVFAVALLSLNAFAADKSLTKSAKPPHIVVAKNGGAMSQFNVMSYDFSGRGMLLAKKTLTSIDWRTTHYPENLNEEVEICYTEPGRIEYALCRKIDPDSSGTTYAFNSFKFDMHARVTIRHSVKGGRDSGRSAGEDTVVINYRVE